MLHLDNVNNNKQFNQLNKKEMILTVEEFSQKDKLQRHKMPVSNINNKFSNNNKTKRDTNCKCRKYNRNNSKWLNKQEKPK